MRWTNQILGEGKDPLFPLFDDQIRSILIRCSGKRETVSTSPHIHLYYLRTNLCTSMSNSGITGNSFATLVTSILRWYFVPYVQGNHFQKRCCFPPQLFTDSYNKRKPANMLDVNEYHLEVGSGRVLAMDDTIGEAITDRADVHVRPGATKEGGKAAAVRNAGIASCERLPSFRHALAPALHCKYDNVIGVDLKWFLTRRT